MEIDFCLPGLSVCAGALKCCGTRRDAETENPEAERKEGQGGHVTDAGITWSRERKAVRSHVSTARFEKS